NGEPLEADAAPGGYLSLEREWWDGDEIVLQVPLALRSVPTIDDPAVHSMELGPTVLLARSEETTRQALPLAGNRLLDGTLRTSEPTQALVTRLADEGVVQIARPTRRSRSRARTAVSPIGCVRPGSPSWTRSGSGRPSPPGTSSWTGWRTSSWRHARRGCSGGPRRSGCCAPPLAPISTATAPPE